MRNLTVTLCLTLAVLLGSAACAPNSGQEPVISSNAVADKPNSSSAGSFIRTPVHLHSGPGLRFPVTKVVKEAIGKEAILLKQNDSWIQIRFEGEDFWVLHLSLDRNLKPPVARVLFRASKVILRSGPGRRFPMAKVLTDAKYKIAVPFGKFENWVHIVFDKRPYWVHSELLLQHETRVISPKSAEQGANQLSFFDEVKMKAVAGDATAMELVGGIYEHNENLHLEMSYMWLSLAMEDAALTDKKRIRKHLEESIISKLNDGDIASAEKRMERCKKSKYRDCGETRIRVFHKR